MSKVPTPEFGVAKPFIYKFSHELYLQCLGTVKHIILSIRCVENSVSDCRNVPATNIADITNFQRTSALAEKNPSSYKNKTFLTRFQTGEKVIQRPMNASLSQSSVKNTSNSALSLMCTRCFAFRAVMKRTCWPHEKVRNVAPPVHMYNLKPL